METLFLFDFVSITARGARRRWDKTEAELFFVDLTCAASTHINWLNAPLKLCCEQPIKTENNNNKLLHLWATHIVTGVDVDLQEHNTIFVTTF